jgi:hypothetical protein
MNITLKFEDIAAAERFSGYLVGALHAGRSYLDADENGEPIETMAYSDLLQLQFEVQRQIDIAAALTPRSQRRR